jgi:hypothetical protein
MMRKRLAWFDKPNMKGKIHIHPEVRKEPDRARRIRAHMKKAQEVYASTGDRKKAIREGLKTEHKGMTPRQVRLYELENASIARRISVGEPRRENWKVFGKVSVKRNVQGRFVSWHKVKARPPREVRIVEVQGRGPKAIEVYGVYHGRVRRVRRRGTGRSLYRWVKKQKERGVWDAILEVES